MLPQFTLEEIISKEEMVVVVGNRFYIPTTPIAELSGNFVKFQQTAFALEECDLLSAVIDLYFETNKEQIEQTLLSQLQISGTDVSRYHKYLQENKIFHSVLTLFEELKPRIGYSAHLEMENYKPFSVPDKTYLMHKFSTKLSDQFSNSTAGSSAQQSSSFFETLFETIKLRIPYLYDSIICNSVVYFINEDKTKLSKSKKKQKMEKASLAVSIDGKDFYFKKEKSIFLMQELYDEINAEIKKIIQDHLAKQSLESLEEIAQHQRYQLQKRFDEGDFVSHGLIFKYHAAEQKKKDNSHNECSVQFELAFVIPNYLVNVPGKLYYIQFEQAELSTWLIQNNNYGSNHKVYDYTPLMYSKPDQHPLIIPNTYSDHGQVCLRESDAELKKARSLGLFGELGAEFLLTRNILFNGENMFNAIDWKTFIRGTFDPNVHRVSKWKYRSQRVYNPEPNSFIIRQNGDS